MTPPRQRRFASFSPQGATKLLGRPGEFLMKFPDHAFERTGTAVAAEANARFECGVCWCVYDPAEGDPVWQVAPGTPFAALPDHWTCPNCEAARERFLVLPNV